MKHKRNDPMCDAGIPKGMKIAVSISIAFCLDFFLSEMKV